MYSEEHLVVSLAVGAGFAAITATPSNDAAVMAFAAFLGVVVDVDHFVISRLHRDDWSAVREALVDVRTAVGRGTVFDPDEVRPHHRLLTHHLLGGAVVAVLAVTAPELAVLAALVVYTHVVGDLYADVFRDGDYFADAG